MAEEQSGLEELFSSCVIVSVFWLWREIVFRVTQITSCAIVSVFWLWGEIVFGFTVSKKNSYWVSLMEKRSTSKCVYFVRSKHLFTLYLPALQISCTLQIHRLTVTIVLKKIKIFLCKQELVNICNVHSKKLPLANLLSKSMKLSQL